MRATYKHIVPDTYLDSMSYELRENSFQKALDDKQIIVYAAEEVYGWEDALFKTKKSMCWNCQKDSYSLNFNKKKRN